MAAGGFSWKLQSECAGPAKLKLLVGLPPQLQHIGVTGHGGDERIDTELSHLQGEGLQLVQAQRLIGKLTTEWRAQAARISSRASGGKRAERSTPTISEARLRGEDLDCAIRPCGLLQHGWTLPSSFRYGSQGLPHQTHVCFARVSL